MDLLLPYKIGDLAESKSFLNGYRGAWFRCKVHNMRVNDSGYLECYLEYIDYDGEDLDWVAVFQENPASSSQNSKGSTEVMIRPSFPQWYYGHEPDQLPVSDVTAVVDEAWKIGDMVDWLKDGCYWSGTITKLLKKDMVKGVDCDSFMMLPFPMTLGSGLQLPAPPIGEGRCYIANHKDLRPTLEWSLEKGWTVPLAQVNDRQTKKVGIPLVFFDNINLIQTRAPQVMKMAMMRRGECSNRCPELETCLRKPPRSRGSYENAQKDATVTPVQGECGDQLNFQATRPLRAELVPD
ncbi:Agenet domain-containing protein [Zea mays]|uniref:Agenet domain-containing protein n=1 Tax=Zea mays TaxID=4577 RepID=A0A1D6F0Q1_MAIZE|nr:Agenet domain-containing protein [Zea mays]